MRRVGVFRPAEAAADKYHGVQKFDVITGEQAKAPPGPPAYQNVFGETLAKLADSDPRNWVARVMLAVLHYKKKDMAKMDQEFDAAARFNKKQGVLYGVWAWCHWKNDNTQRAIQILSQGDTELEGKDERLRQNLLNLQNGKKMKMKGYAEQWYQFHLEKPPQPKPQVAPRPQPKPQMAPRPQPKPQVAPRPQPRPQAAPQPKPQPKAVPQQPYDPRKKR